GRPHAARLHPARLHARGRGTRLRVGRPGADLLRPPRHVVGELDLPLLRPPAVRHRGPLDERGLAGRVLARRVLASQPSCVPALGLPRAALVGARPLRAVHLRPAAGRACLERGADHARTTAAEDRRAGRPGSPEPGRRLTIREARPEDWEAIWPFFCRIVAAGETYAYDREMSEAEG